MGWTSQIGQSYYWPYYLNSTLYLITFDPNTLILYYHGIN